MILLFNIGFLDIKWVDIADILLVSIFIYQVYKLMRGSMAIKVFLGFLSLYLSYLVVKAAEMELLTSILGQFMGLGVLAVIILFQQEIRKFLLLLGKTTIFEEGNLIKGIKSLWNSDSTKKLNVTGVLEAVKVFGGSNTGALIVFSRNSELKFYAESGDRLDALISKRLIQAIFNKYSPLHDGAAILYQGRIVAARCILPVTDRDDLPASLGLRHRAAVGMSEATDTLMLVVSEETGQISVVRNGNIHKNLSIKEVRKMINEYLKEKDTKSKNDKPKSDDGVKKILDEAKKKSAEKAPTATA
ncbi:MAG TPA: diadenylate cyclase CdaA [Cyclobacteriaceae bacterium]